MSDVTDLIDCYISAWNEGDAERRQKLIARTWTPDARYVDPMLESEGHAGIDGMIRSVQARFPEHRFRRTSEVEAHPGAVLVKNTLIALTAVECLTTRRAVSRNTRRQNLHEPDVDAYSTPRERRTLNVLRRIESRQFTEVGHHRRRRWSLPAAGAVSAREY